MTREDISSLLTVFPEEWKRSKKQYVRLVTKGSSNAPIWLGQRYDFSPNRSKAKVEYSEDDISKLENAPDFSRLQVRNSKGTFRFQKEQGKWIPVSE